jgi:hypothetical protein
MYNREALERISTGIDIRVSTYNGTPIYRRLEILKNLRAILSAFRLQY